MLAKALALGFGLSLALVALGQVPTTAMPDVQMGQSIADIFRNTSGADLALVASGFMVNGKDSKELLPSFLFPGDELWLVSLSGKQVSDAFEKSLSFYPEPGPDTLYFSGAEVAIQASRNGKAKVFSATIGGLTIDPAKTYKVAMPASLARGGLSYFTVWNFQKPEKVISPAIKKLLEGKNVQTSTLRWLLHQSL